MKALSLDLRQRIAHAIDHDTLDSYPKIADRFAVSLASVERIATRKRCGQSLAPGQSTGRKPKVTPEQYDAFECMVASRTDWTTTALADAWQERTGQGLSLSTVLRLLHRIGFSFKKSVRWLPSETKNGGTPSARK